jgi:phospholipid-binding lipoprotein MlaA
MTSTMCPTPSLAPWRLHCIALALLLGLTGCAAAGAPRNPDPFEPVNRGVHKFNDVLDRYAMKPVARAYHDHVPEPVQSGVRNFFTNLSYPATAVNQLLQGKVVASGQDTLRFAINTTLGWGGIFDVASGANLPLHDEDSGQTLGRWGVPPGPYIVLPFLGPATLRDAPARVADDFYRPFYWYDSGTERWFSLALELVDKRSRYLPLDRVLQETYDPYTFVRDAYMQRRLYAVYDGNPPADEVEDESDWAEEALREDEAGNPEEALPEDDAAQPEGGSPDEAEPEPPGQ